MAENFRDLRGTQVFVKNTFLTFAATDGMDMPALVRARTAPATSGETGEAPVDEKAEESEEDDRDDLAPLPEGLSPAPPMEELSRAVTCDTFETEEGWTWGGAGADIPPPLEVQPQAQPQMQQQALVMQQAQMQPVMVPMHPQMMPPGVVMVMPSQAGMGFQQMDSFAPWPVGMMPMGLPPGAMPIALAGVPGPMGVPSSYAAAPVMQEVPASSPAMSSSGGMMSDSCATRSGAPPPPPQPQTLNREKSVRSQCERFCWTVDARKLKGADKVAVSPPFDMQFGDHTATFKMMIYPTVTNDGKGGASFKKAKGKGSIQVKCEAELADYLNGTVTYRLCIGSTSAAGDRKSEPHRGPVKHNFSTSGVSSLQKDMEEWDFMKVIDEASQTFVVCLEVMWDSC